MEKPLNTNADCAKKKSLTIVRKGDIRRAKKEMEKQQQLSTNAICAMKEKMKN